MRYAKRNLPVIVILLALLLIIFVIWFYNKRIESMDRKVTTAIIKVDQTLISEMRYSSYKLSRSAGQFVNLAGEPILSPV